MFASLQIDDSPGDVELVRQLVGGSEAALAVLYDRHAPTVLRVALRLNRDRGLAEDVVQETFLTLWNRAEQFDPSRGSLPAWLTTIARNRAIDRGRANSRRVNAQPFSVVAADQPDEAATVDWLMASGSPIGASAPDPQPEAILAAREAQATVAGAVATLSDDERQAILLAYRDGLSQSEIATRLGWPLGTVKTRSRRALRRLREQLQPLPPAASQAPTWTPPEKPGGSAGLAGCGATCG